MLTQSMQKVTILLQHVHTYMYKDFSMSEFKHYSLNAVSHNHYVNFTHIPSMKFLSLIIHA